MKCTEAKKHILDYTGGAAAPPGLLSHVKSCKKCAREFEAAKKIAAALSLKEKVRVPGGFNAGVWAKIGEPAPSLFNRIFMQPANYLKAAAAAAAFLILFFAARNFSGVREIKMADKNAVQEEEGVKAKKIVTNVEKIEDKKISAHSPDTPVKENGDKNIKNNELAVNNEKPRSIFKEVIKGRGSSEKPQVIKAAAEENKVTAAKERETPLPTMEEDIKVYNNIVKPLLNKGVVIRYKVEEAAEISIVVYSKMGEPVKKIFTGEKTRGVYEAEWKGADENGTIVADGIYIIYVKTGLTEEKVKVVVVK